MIPDRLYEDTLGGPTEMLAGWKFYVHSAIAAIAAMREPTEAMLEAVYGLCGETSGSDRIAAEVWRTMIDAADA